jgi:hypothetical protein
MKTYLIPSQYRHSVVEYFDQLVKEGSVTQFFIGDIDPEYGCFYLLYKKADHVIDFAIPQFRPFSASIELDIKESKADESTTLDKLSNLLSAIDIFSEDMGKEKAIQLIQEYVEVTMSCVDFEDDGHFKVNAELQWRD